MRKALDVSKPSLIFGQDFEHSIGFVFRAKTLGNFACVLVRTTYKSNRARCEHGGKASAFHINADKMREESLWTETTDETRCNRTVHSGDSSTPISYSCNDSSVSYKI